MNENHKIKQPEPVLIKRDIVTEYERHYKEMVKLSWLPQAEGTNSPIVSLGMAIEAEYVLTHLFGVPSEVITELNKEAINECETNSGDVPDQEES